MAFRAAASLLALALGSDALRKHPAASIAGSRAEVATLYTFGAPKVSSPALRNPLTPNGCFPGWRVVNKNDEWWDLTDDVDVVPTLLGTLSGYAHINIDVQFIDQRGRSTYHECGWVGTGINTAKITLHFTFVYVRRAEKNDNLREVTLIGLDHSYNANVEEVADAVGQYGWNVVSAVVGVEVVHLMQNPRTSACILTFGGSDTFEDWVKDVMIITTSFCGLEQRVHLGFKLELLQMVKDEAFQTHVRPNLGYCSKVEVMGHSLGGAVAALFTACAHNYVQEGADGYEDYKYLSWTRSAPRMLPALGKNPNA